ncbi:hypothetical protein MYX77_13195, partial [Acidobacteriia bacterium AH_259_A11_L15]|nr:hypothetical protein [Acidobacteriia bacterium AH_259_A11_L15]
MMAYLSLLVLTAWTIVLLRLLGARATLSERTYLTYLLLGASLGVLAMPLVRLLFAPYGEFWPYQRLLISVGWQAVLL